ncbi:hypothetical protein ES703_105586 [subsurface metagenome]
MAKAKWARVSPGLLAALTPMPGGTMVMATIAKKHLTIFTRRRRCRKPPGHPDVKAAFSEAAKKTLGEEDRAKRNAIVKAGVEGKGPGVRIYKSRARIGSPLYGKVTKYKTK